MKKQIRQNKRNKCILKWTNLMRLRDQKDQDKCWSFCNQPDKNFFKTWKLMAKIICSDLLKDKLKDNKE